MRSALVRYQRPKSYPGRHNVCGFEIREEWGPNSVASICENCGLLYVSTFSVVVDY